MNTSVLRAILILPGTALVVIPAVILFFTRNGIYAWELSGWTRPQFWLALACCAAGLALMASTVAMFSRIGEGTPAPWQPPRKLVVQGVYRRVRNPMISGVFLVMLGEALAVQSLPILAWAALFMGLNMTYIPFIEEPGLEKRFGEDYRAYKANVPRWVPRLRPWEGQDDS